MNIYRKCLHLALQRCCQTAILFIVMSFYDTQASGPWQAFPHLQGKEHKSQNVVTSLLCFSPSLVDMVTEVPSRWLCHGLRWSPKPREVETEQTGSRHPLLSTQQCRILMSKYCMRAPLPNKRFNSQCSSKASVSNDFIMCN